MGGTGLPCGNRLGPVTATVEPRTRRGLDWVATVPPTVALCRQHFGIERSGVVFGWVFAAHMVGAGVAASFAGSVRQVNGDYFSAWMTAGGLCLGAAALCLLIPRHPAVPVETATTAQM